MAQDDQINQKENVVSDFAPVDARPERADPEKSRKNIAYVVVGGYIILLTLNISVPILLYVFSKKNIQMAEVKDLILSISSAISGMSGVLGFIMGYYFKSGEDEKKS